MLNRQNKHILYHEQEVCGKRYKNRKNLLTMVMSMLALLLNGRARGLYLLFKEKKAKEDEMDFWDCHLTFHVAPKLCGHSSRKTIIDYKLMVSNWSLNDSKSSQVLRTLLSILVDLNNVFDSSSNFQPFQSPFQVSALFWTRLLELVSPLLSCSTAHLVLWQSSSLCASFRVIWFSLKNQSGLLLLLLLLLFYEFSHQY